MMTDTFVRELSNGQWFVLSMVMTTFCITYATVRPVSIGHYTPNWFDDAIPADTQFALSLAIYMAGSTLRAGYIWVLLHCQNARGSCDYIQNNAWLMLVASALAVIGGLWFIRTLSPPQWRPWSWVGAGLFSLSLPFFYYTTGQWTAFLKPSGIVVSGSHDMGLVTLSVVVACMASYVALDLGERARHTRGFISYVWLIAAAVVMGGGIWSMHFVAMLAFTIPGVNITYDLELTLLSLVLPIVFSAIGLVVVRNDNRTASLVAAGVMIGISIAAMHYTGMAAMRMPFDLSYDALFFAISIMIAIGVSVIAVWVAFSLENTWHKVVASIAQGSAIAGMHYVAMVAAIFHMPIAQHNFPPIGISNVDLAIGVTSATMMIFILALGAAAYDRHRR
jgi:NO-binding membrane sensor protein with MHYT domain